MHDDSKNTIWSCRARALYATVLLCGAGLAPLGAAAGEADGDAGLRLATFVCEITPPQGHPLCGGWIKPLEGVDDPLLAKGVILRDRGAVCVLCVLDWCELRNDAYELFRRKLAAAAGTSPSKVAVHCIHAHNAPITDRGAQVLLKDVKEAPVHADLEFLEQSAQKVAAALRDSMRQWRRVTHVGTARARVERVASNRRLEQPDGSIRVRYSSAKDKRLRDAPEGLIDPWLRSVTFHDGDSLLACMHYYASHPQSYYGDGRATPDFPGIARERLEDETGVFQLYFTGCAGNVAAGKYNDGTPSRREELADRMLDAMRRSLGAISRQEVKGLAWKARDVRFPLRKEPEHGEAAQRKVLGDVGARAVDRIQAALALTTQERCRDDVPFELTSLRLGRVCLLHLPGEPFVEFQLEAQRLRPDLFVAVAGYADCAMGYLCTERSYAEGGYEPTASLLDPVAEHYLRSAVKDLLSDNGDSVRLLSVKKIWDAAPHNAFTDLVRHRGQWFCAFREGAKHVSPEANIRVIKSPDGEQWESAALLSKDGVDLRDPKLSLAPNGRLCLLGGWRQWPPAHKEALGSWVAFSMDGSTWTERRRVLSEGEWLWRITWRGAKAYGVAYGRLEGSADNRNWSSRLYSTSDGIAYDPVSTFSMRPGLTEATIRFADDGTAFCIHRRDAETRTALLGTSKPPYKEWSWRDSGFYLGGPNAIRHRGQWYAAGRWMVGPPATVLARVDWSAGTLEPILRLPSGGDTSYPGLASQDNELWISYYASHEGKSAIYLARLSSPSSP